MTRIGWLVVVCLQVHAQSVTGGVHDGNNHPVGDAPVALRGAQSFTTRTAADGTYRFDSLPPGTYTVRAEKDGSGVATFGPFSITGKDAKTVDLRLESAPQFFDEPQFVVAGVTESTYQGGHGSGMAVRSSEALAKATAALSKDDLITAKDALEAARAYQRAAEAAPTEPNLFNWGTDLLVHRAAEQAVAVFEKGHTLYPASVRMLLGLATGWYARGVDDQALRYFFTASDLKPSDPTPYLFLAKLPQADGMVERFARFARLQPENASANYFYAASLWRERKDTEDIETSQHIQSLLDKAIRLDSGLAPAHLLQGIVYAQSKRSQDAIAAYRKAVEADPGLEEAHYRLAQEYRRTGETAGAQKELAIYQELSKQSEERMQRERAAIPQFVITLRNAR